MVLPKQRLFSILLNPATLPAGFSIDSIDGKPYLKVAPDRWNTILPLPDSLYIPANETGFRFKAKIVLGTGETNPASNIMTLIQPMGTGDTGLFKIEEVSSVTFKKFSGSALAGKVGSIQFAFQQMSGGRPVLTLDTLYIGLIETYDASVLFDPASYTGVLAAGDSIVEIDGTKYLKAKCLKWNSYILIDTFKTLDYNKFTVEYKLQIATSGLTNAKLQAFI